MFVCNSLMLSKQCKMHIPNKISIYLLLMEILHIENLRDTECHLAVKAVVVVPGEYQISIATYLRGVSTLI